MIVKKLNLDKLKSEIEIEGFSIIMDVIDKQVIKDLKNFWLDFIKSNKVKNKFARGSLILGEENFLSYSKISSWCMYRNFDFLWNKPTNKLSFELSLYFHHIRNKILNHDKSFGTSYNNENYGIYFSTSLYPVDEGMLEYHIDGHEDVPILHFMIPLTFKGENYEAGGLYVYNKKNKKIDVDNQCSPGSIIFFDGRLKHGVETIKGGNTGRLAMFAVPTFFESSWRLKFYERKAKIYFREIQNQINYFLSIIKIK